MDESADPRRYLTAKHLAEMFEVSIRTVYSYVDQGLLPYTRVGPRLLRFSEDDIREFVRRRAGA